MLEISKAEARKKCTLRGQCARDAPIQLGYGVEAVGDCAERQALADETTDGEIGAAIRFSIVGVDSENAAVLDVPLAVDDDGLDSVTLGDRGRFVEIRLRRPGQ